jgi:hypothetical protein
MVCLAALDLTGHCFCCAKLSKLTNPSLSQQNLQLSSHARDLDPLCTGNNHKSQEILRPVRLQWSTPAPSASTNPSRSLSKGREAELGVSLCLVLRARMREKPARDTASTHASVPPAAKASPIVLLRMGCFLSDVACHYNFQFAYHYTLQFANLKGSALGMFKKGATSSATHDLTLRSYLTCHQHRMKLCENIAHITAIRLARNGEED